MANISALIFGTVKNDILIHWHKWEYDAEVVQTQKRIVKHEQLLLQRYVIFILGGKHMNHIYVIRDYMIGVKWPDASFARVCGLAFGLHHFVPCKRYGLIWCRQLKDKQRMNKVQWVELRRNQWRLQRLQRDTTSERLLLTWPKTGWTDWLQQLRNRAMHNSILSWRCYMVLNVDCCLNRELICNALPVHQ